MSDRRSEPTFSHEQREALLEAVCKLLKDKYAFPDVASRAVVKIRELSERGSYDGLEGEAEFAEAVTGDLQRLTRDSHLRVVFDPVRVDALRGAGTRGGDRDPSEISRLRNHGFARVENLKGNVGYVDIRHFFAPSIAEETAAAAMRCIADSDTVLVDLRNNTGGNPSMVQFLCSYFFGGETPVHLNSITSRPQRKTTEYWTLPHVPGKRMPDVPLYVLVSAHTFSGGEEFAYNMASLERGTVVGESTAGGANPAGIDILSDRFYATIPHATPTNPVTQGNWEGCGVEPHIATHADRALETAHILALQRLAEKAPNETGKAKLRWFLEEVESSYHPIPVPTSTLERYAGRYGDCEVLPEGDALYCRRRFFRYRLVPLEETLFWLDGPAAGFESRLEFVPDQSGAIGYLVGRFPDGREITHHRE